MKCIIVNCFPSDYELRTAPIIEYFIEKEYQVLSYTSNFDHYNKAQIQLHNGQIQIKVPPYRRNVSFFRLWSHFLFSYKIWGKLKREKPDIIYVNVPPNSLVFFVGLYCMKNKAVKWIMDVCDLWPESLPLTEKQSRFVKFPLQLWKKLRNAYLERVNLLMLECNMYKPYFTPYISREKIEVFYMCQKSNRPIVRRKGTDRNVSFCYIGTINRLIDLSLTEKFLRSLSGKMNVEVHVIGEGEKKDEYLKLLKNCCQKLNYYGIIFDEEEKRKILRKSDWGLNLVKDGLKIGLTTKSIEYLRAGLPLVNSVQGDTRKLLSDYQAGINIDRKHIEKSAELFVKSSREQMSDNARTLFEKEFSTDALKLHFSQCMERL